MTTRSVFSMLLLTLPLTLSIGCSGESGDDDDDDDDTTPTETPVVDCSGTIPTFSEVTIWPACTSCHASDLSGASRSGAPPDINFDVYTSAKDYATLAVAEVDSGSMPIGGSVEQSQKDSLRKWAQCGTPE